MRRSFSAYIMCFAVSILCFLNLNISFATCTAGFHVYCHRVAVGVPFHLVEDGVPGSTYRWSDNGVEFDVHYLPHEHNYIFGSVGTHILKMVVSTATCADSISDTITVVPAGSWQEVTSFPSFASPLNESATFSIGSNFYVCGGVDNSANYVKGTWKYNTTTTTWTQVADIPGYGRAGAISFTIADKGYVGTGRKGLPYSYLQDFYQYDTTLNSWSPKASLPSDRGMGIGFAINGKGYCGLGSNLSGMTANKRDLYEYDPVADTWTPKANYPVYMVNALSFVLNGKCYVYGGQDGGGGISNAHYKYDPVTDTWTTYTSMPVKTFGKCAFSVNGRGYVSGDYIYTSFGSENISRLFEYNDTTDSWSEQPFYAYVRHEEFGTAVSGIAFAGMGYNSSLNVRDVWGYLPDANITYVNIPPVATISYSPNDSACAGQVVNLNTVAIGDATYQWFHNGNPISGATATLAASVSGTYSVIVTTPGGTDTSSSVSVTIVSPSIPVITQSGTTLTSSSASSYQWFLNGNPISGATSQNYICSVDGSYTVQTTNSLGCTAVSDPFIVTFTGISEHAWYEFEIIPNPVNDKISISTDLAESTEASFEMFSLDGRLLSRTDLGIIPAGKKTINITDNLPKDLKPGIYFIEIHLGNRQITRKILKS